MKKIIPYEASFGPYTLPEGFAESLAGLTIEEQMNRYRLSLSRVDAMTGWRQRTSGTWYIRLDEVSDVRALIVHEGILVGVMLNDYRNIEIPCFADERVCTDYDEDNNGAGYKIRASYVYLLCVAEDFQSA